MGMLVPHSRLALAPMATDGLMKLHTHCKEQMMEVQAVPILQCPMHEFCPHGSRSYVCCSLAQERGLRKPPGPQYKIHSQLTGLNLSWILSTKKSKSFSFSERTLALDYTSGEVVDLSQTLQSCQGHTVTERCLCCLSYTKSLIRRI